MRLAAELSKNRNLKITVFCQQRSVSAVKATCVSDEVVFVILKSGIFGLTFIKKIGRIFELVDLILKIVINQYASIVVCANPGYLSGVLSLFKSRKQNYIVANAMLFSDLPISFFHKFWLRVVTKFATRIDNLSSEPKTVLEHLLCPKEILAKQHVAPCSFTDYANVISAKNRDIDILMLARFVPGKGYELLEEVDPFLKGYNFHVCGFGRRPIQLQSAKIYNTERPFEVLGRTKVFLSLQTSNNYPSQSLLEAMASGCAIIATDVGETRKLLDKTCAMLIPPCSNKLLVAIEALMGDPSAREALGSAARDRVLSTQTVSAYADYFEKDLLGMRKVSTNQNLD